MLPSAPSLPPSPTTLATTIHTTLIHFCAATPATNYRSGVFAREITARLPVLDCLSYLTLSPHTSATEKKVFTTVRTLLFGLMVQEASGRVFTAREMGRHVPVTEKLLEVFERDQRNRGVLQLPGDDMGRSEVKLPEDYTGEGDDIVSILLQTTLNAIVLACASPKGYKSGIFRGAITPSTPLLVAFSTLCTDTRVSSKESEVFKEAKGKAGTLLELQKGGVKSVEVKGGMWEEHERWFAPVLGVFERDCERRGVGTPAWAWYGGEK
ncbi:hypothetical protein MMC30_002306 [Trapelia coarctata]|nr:hypothetical protein [Trapelia coarctata]